MSLIQTLLDRKAVNAEQVEEALYAQKESGGHAEDHLYRLGYVDRPALLTALQASFGDLVIDLSDRRIAPDVLSMLPADTAWKYQVIPFAYDHERDTLSIACRNPLDGGLLSALAGATSGFDIQLFAAPGPALLSALTEYYRSVAARTVEHPWDGHQPVVPSDITHPDRAILIVGKGDRADEGLAQALADEGAEVVMVDTPDEALAELQQRNVTAVLIRDRNENAYGELMNCLRTTNPGCTVRFFESASSLIFDSADDTDELAHIMTSNLHLFASVMAVKQGMPVENGVRIGSLTDRLCTRLGLSTRDRMVIVSAAYLQDLAGVYFDGSAMMDTESRLFMLLSAAGEALIFSPAVVSVTRAMNRISACDKTDSLSIDMLGGNILSVVSFYCRLFPFDTRLTAHQYDVVAENLRGRANRDFLPEIVELFLDILKDDVVGPTDSRIASQVLMVNRFGEAGTIMHNNMLRLGYACTSVDSVDECVFRFEQLHPDILLVAQSGSPEQAVAVIEELTRRGIRLQETPVFVVIDDGDLSAVAQLLRMGVEDVIESQGDIDVLLVKMQRIQSSQEKESRQRLSVLHDMGTHGSLTHMNVIDLLQAMGHGEKTVRISVSAEGQQLTMYLGQGKLLYAECGDCIGPDAVFEALAWSRGIWSVDQIGNEELPNSNIHRSIDSILIEGVHRVDERNRPATPSQPAQFG